jgi:hypothetical protein
MKISRVLFVFSIHHSAGEANKRVNSIVNISQQPIGNENYFWISSCAVEFRHWRYYQVPQTSINHLGVVTKPEE